MRANTGTALGYGADEWTARLQDRFSELFETPVRVFPVATGTAANALSLAAIGPVLGQHLLQRGGAHQHLGGERRRVFRRRAEARAGRRHARPDRPGGIARDAGRARPRRSCIAASRPRSTSPRRAISARSTRLDEVRAIAEAAKAHGLKVHMDGARFANAVARLGMQPGRDELAGRRRHHVVRRDQERRRAVRRDRRVQPGAGRRARGATCAAPVRSGRRCASPRRS